MLSALDKRLLNDFQQDFPLTTQPYLQIARQLGVSESEVIEHYQQLCEQDYISRIGPVIAPNRMGASALVAMAVDADELDAVAELVSAYPGVNHNYERENRYNLWFVLMAENKLALESLVADIEQRSGYQAMLLPMLADFYINLGFELELDNVESG